MIITRFVEENDAVTENQVLFEIDPVDVSAEYEQAKQRLSSFKIKRRRLNLEVSGEDLTPQPDLVGSNAAVFTAEENLFLSRRQELANKIAIFENKIQQTMKRILSSKASVQMELDLLEFIDREIALIKPLVKQNIAPETRLLELLREKERNRGSRENSRLSMAEAEIALEELGQQIISTRENYKLQALDELSKVVSEIAEID
ncbi:MAG: hypothetical protein ACKVLN_01805 [Rhodobacterales bacterium]